MLFKAAVFGRDANWGRIMAAAGYSGADVDPTRADCIIKSAAGEVQVMKDGFGADFSEELAKKVLTEHDITVIVRFYQGDGEANGLGLRPHLRLRQDQRRLPYLIFEGGCTMSDIARQGRHS